MNPDLIPVYLDWEVTDEIRRAAQELDPADFPEGKELLLAWQGERCALCGRSGETLLTDHDHQTALVRGMLCPRCNGAEGRASRWDPPSWAAQYRMTPPASRLGLTVIYHDLFGPVAPEPPLMDPDSEETYNAVQAMFAQIAAGFREAPVPRADVEIG